MIRYDKKRNETTLQNPGEGGWGVSEGVTGTEGGMRKGEHSVTVTNKKQANRSPPNQSSAISDTS